MDGLQGVHCPETGEGVPELVGADDFFVFGRLGKVLEKADGGVEEVGVAGFFDDVGEGPVDLRGVDEFYACFFGDGEISEHDAGADLELELGT